jgi:hypothetical protein
MISMRFRQKLIISIKLQQFNIHLEKISIRLILLTFFSLFSQFAICFEMPLNFTLALSTGTGSLRPGQTL